MRKPIRLITAGEIKQYYSMKQAIDSMERAFSLLSSGESFVPLRFVSKLPSNEMMMLFKPAYVEKEKRIAVKFLTQRENGSSPEIPIIQGIVLIIDADTGEILSIMDGEYLTALRTGAASGLATRYFARKDANTLALFGCGAQGRTQMEAVACERDIKKVLVFDKNKDRADLFIREMREKFQIEMVYTSDTSLLNEADIICTATSATEPLFKKEVLKMGVHINAIGSFQAHMQELDPYILADAKVYVDQIESCLKESGDFIKPIAQEIFQKSIIVGEIGDFCLNKIAGRESEDEITVFKSVGIAIQDYTVATDIYNNSFENSFGHDINLFE
jgi:ornithine cyclodeaminase/alanine dehydrogenase-like protein (mu-crystallin family)